MCKYVNSVYDIVVYNRFDMWNNNKRAGDMKYASSGNGTLELDFNTDSFVYVFLISFFWFIV